MIKEIAQTPVPPYYAVIFTSKRTDGDNGYSQLSDKMNEMVKDQPGFLGFESARNEIGISISYWKSLDDIQNWKFNYAHLLAQKKGKETWYQGYKVRICAVERDYEF